MILIYISFYDIKYHTIKPNTLFVLIVVTLIKLITIKSFKYYFISSLVIFLMFYILFLFSKSMGGGDGKLFSVIGLYFGFKATSIIFVISIFTSFPFALYYSMDGDKKKIAFAPFITFGTAISLILPILNFRL